jgi:hypothetical protein
MSETDYADARPPRWLRAAVLASCLLCGCLGTLIAFVIARTASTSDPTPPASPSKSAPGDPKQSVFERKGAVLKEIAKKQAIENSPQQWDALRQWVAARRDAIDDTVPGKRPGRAHVLGLIARLENLDKMRQDFPTAAPGLWEQAVGLAQRLAHATKVAPPFAPKTH